MKCNAAELISDRSEPRQAGVLVFMLLDSVEQTPRDVFSSHPALVLLTARVVPVPVDQDQDHGDEDVEVGYTNSSNAC